MTQQPASSNSDTPWQPALRPSILRVLGAQLYDLLLLIGLFMLSTALLMPITEGKAIPSTSLWYRAYLLGIAWAFMITFWRRDGRTLGMRSWRIRLLPIPGQTLGVTSLSIRFFVALLSWLCLGIGHFWRLIDANKLTWQDKFSGSYLVYEPKKPS